MTTLYTSNDPTTGFDATAIGTLPAGWTAISGTWAVSTTGAVDGHSHALACTSAADGQVALATGITPAVDMDVVYSQANLGTGNTVSIIMRADAGYNNAYLFTLAPNSTGGGVLYSFKRTGGSYAALGFNASYSLSMPSAPLMIRGRVQGSTVQLKLWSAGTQEPTNWTGSFTDSSVTGAGVPGFYCTNSGGVVVGVDDYVASSLAAAAVTVDTPAAQSGGAMVTLTGTYTGTAPTGIDVAFDGASGFVTGGSFAAASNIWHATAVVPAASGLHWLTVREDNAPSVTAASGVFSVSGTAAPAATISVATPATTVAGSTLAVSGSYTGTAPTGLAVAFDGGSYATVASPTVSGGSFSFGVIAPSAGSHTLTVEETNATTVTATSGSFSTTAAVNNANATTLAPNHPALLYSPYNWNVAAAAATTINAGAGLRTLFSGASCTLNFNVTNNAAPLSQIWYRIDGEGPWTMAPVAASVACTIPSATAGNADVPYHLLELVVKSTTETQNRWNTPSATAVVFTGLSLASGAVAIAPLAAPISILCLGDSITEGVRTLGEAAANDTDRNDAMLGWAWRLGALLGAEAGVVGFGGSGLSVTGSGNVPVLSTSFSQLYQGTPRSFAPAPALVVINIGTNDGSNATTAAMTGTLNGVMAACTGVPIAVLRPFNGNQAANLQAAIAACSNPLMVHYIDTTGVFDTSKGADSLSLHPAGPNNLGLIAPALAALLRPLLGNSRPAAFHGGFQRGLLG